MLVGTLLVFSGVLALVVFSPQLLRYVFDPSAGWARLSSIGQTYGAASAVLSALALVGVAFSLVLQQRESRSSREHALRALHIELLRMSLDNDAYLECWGQIGDSVDNRDWYRQHIYINLIVSHWQMMWEIGALSENHLRLVSSQLFRGPLGRKYWSEASRVRPAVEGGRRARRLHVILKEEYEAALSEIAVSASDVREEDEVKEDVEKAQPGPTSDGSR